MNGRAAMQYRYYLLGLLTLIASLNFLDRTVLSLLLEPIKQDLDLSDSQLGFLTGFAFASFYAIAGIPLARWSDRGNRNTIIFLTTGLWSALVSLSGFVTSFTQLLLVRVGVAVGEAGTMPAAQSIIADYFKRDERPRAMAIYWMCNPLSVILGFMGGGLLAQHFGWRITFMAIGIPGVLIAILAKLTLREPRLQSISSTKSHIPVVAQPTFMEVLHTLWQHPSFRHLLVAFCLGFFFIVGSAVWIPSFFRRIHGLEIDVLGAWLALAYGAGGLLGASLGGYCFTRFAAGREGLQFRTTALFYVICALIYAAVYFSSHYMALALIGIAEIFFSMCLGVIYSGIQSLSNDRMRSVTIALMFLMANLIGLGCGPMLVGVLSDALASRYGDDSLRYALLLMAPGFAWTGFHLWKTGSTIEADIARVDAQSTAALLAEAQSKGGH